MCFLNRCGQGCGVSAGGSGVGSGMERSMSVMIWQAGRASCSERTISAVRAGFPVMFSVRSCVSERSAAREFRSL